MSSNKQKKVKIKSLVKEMLFDSKISMLKNIDKILDSNAINIDKWDSKESPYILPKAIVSALLAHEADQYSGKGTSFEKEQKKTIKNINYIL